MKHITSQLLQAALEIQVFFDQKNWQFTFIGGLAL